MSSRKPGGDKSAPSKKKGGGPPNTKKVGFVLFALDGVILLAAVIMIATKPSCDTEGTDGDDSEYAADIPGMSPVEVQFQGHETPQLNAFQPAQSWQSTWSSPSYGSYDNTYGAESTSYTGSTGYDYGSSSTYGFSSTYGSPSTSYGSTSDYYGTGSTYGSSYTSLGSNQNYYGTGSTGFGSTSTGSVGYGTDSIYGTSSSTAYGTDYSYGSSTGTSSAWYSPSTWTPTYGSVGSVTDYNNNNIYGTTSTTGIGQVDSVYGSFGSSSSSSSSYGSTSYYTPYNPLTSGAYSPYYPWTSGSTSEAYSPYAPLAGGAYTPYVPSAGGAYTPYVPQAGGAYTPHVPPAVGAYTPHVPPAVGAYTPYVPQAGGAYTPHVPPAVGAYTPHVPPAVGAYTPYVPQAGGAYTPHVPPAVGAYTPDQSSGTSQGASPSVQPPPAPSKNLNPDAEADLTLIPEDQISNPDFKCGVAPIKPNLQRGRIVGGSVAVAHSWPWMARWAKTEGVTLQPTCGGTIVSSRHVIGAYHCIGKDVDPVQKYRVLIGRHHMFDSPGKEYKFAKIRFHPMGERTKDVYFDMVLGTLKEELEFNDKVQPACLPPPNTIKPSGTKCWVTGWGLTQGTGGDEELKQIDLNIVSFEDCADMHPFSKHAIKDEVALCAGEEISRDSCQGDSGGPLTCPENGKSVLYGVVSWGSGCGEGKAGVYAAVSFSMKWFCCTLKDLPTCQGVTCDINSFVKPESEMP